MGNGKTMVSCVAYAVGVLRSPISRGGVFISNSSEMDSIRSSI